jgi:hypothetical protein
VSLRIRQVKPAFWSDAKLLRLSAEVRLFYIGTWCIADDAGWFVWDADQVAIDLHMRPAVVTRSMEALTETGRIVIHPCGHGEVVHLTEHQRLAGPTRRVETVYRTHLSRCPAVSREFPHSPGTVRLGQVRSVEVREPAAGSERRLTEVTDETTGKTTYVALSSVKPS